MPAGQLPGDPAIPMVCLACAHAAKFPDAVEAACGIRPALPPRMADLYEREERVTVLPDDLAEVQAFIRRTRRHECRDHHPVQRLPRRHRADGGPRLRHHRRLRRGRQPPRDGRGRERHRPFPRAHGVQGHAAPRNRARHRRADRGCRRISQRLHLAARRRYYARVLAEDTGLALDIIADILRAPAFARDEIETERGVILSEIGQALDTPDDIIFDWLQEPPIPTSRSASRDPRAAGAGATESPARTSPASSPPLQAGTDDPLGRRRPGSRRDRDAKARRALLSDMTPGGIRPRRGTAAASPGGEAAEQAHFALALAAPAYREDSFSPPDPRRRARRRHVLAPVSGGARASRPLLHHLRARAGLVRQGLMTIYAGTGAEELAESPPSPCVELARIREDLTEAETARARAIRPAPGCRGWRTPPPGPSATQPCCDLGVGCRRWPRRLSASTPIRRRPRRRRPHRRGPCAALALYGPVSLGPMQQRLARGAGGQ